MKYRVGKKQQRALLDDKGHEVALFHKGQEELAKRTCELLNNQVKNNVVLDNVSNILPPLNTVKQEIAKYSEKTIYGDKAHFQNGINWALNYVAKKVKN